MGNPKHRNSKERKRRRRAHDALAKPVFSDCPNCGEQKLPHQACPSCGYYKGKVYIGQETEE